MGGGRKCVSAYSTETDCTPKWVCYKGRNHPVSETVERRGIVAHLTKVHKSYKRKFTFWLEGNGGREHGPLHNMLEENSYQTQAAWPMVWDDGR